MFYNRRVPGLERCGRELVSRIKCPHFHGKPGQFRVRLARVVLDNDRTKVSPHATTSTSAQVHIDIVVVNAAM